MGKAKKGREGQVGRRECRISEGLWNLGESSAS